MLPVFQIYNSTNVRFDTPKCINIFVDCFHLEIEASSQQNGIVEEKSVVTLVNRYFNGKKNLYIYIY